MAKQIQIAEFGGINQADADETIFNRAMQGHENGYAQRALLESSNMQNMDFCQGGIKQRLGSSAYKTITFAASDSKVIGTHLWVDPATGSSIEVAVTDTTIYVKTGASFAQIDDSGGTGYVHNSTVSKCSFAEVDGHLFIGLDGEDNNIQVYRSGYALDNPLSGPQYGIVDASSASGAKTLNVASTTGFGVFNKIIINKGKADEETHYITGINTGVSLTTLANLSSTHTGFSWSAEDPPDKNFSLNSVVWGAGKFVAVGNSDGTNSMILTSTDGETWTERQPTVDRDVDLYSVTFGGGYFVAVGSGNVSGPYVLTSPTGITWTEQTIATSNSNAVFYEVSYGNNLFMAVGNNGVLGSNNIYTASDPTGTWTNKTNINATAMIRAAVNTNGAWVCVGDPIANRALIIRSYDDGDTWTEAYNPYGLTLLSITYGKGKYVAVGESGADGNTYLISSQDAVTWTAHDTPSNLLMYEVRYFDGVFLASGSAGASNTALYYSVDGENWFQSNTSQNLYLTSIAFDGDDTWVLVGQNDGTDATILTSPSPSTILSSNLYVEAFDTVITHEITGAWDKATYLLTELHTRLLFSTGNTIVNYTPQAYTSGSGIWDGANSGFLQVQGSIKSMSSFSPEMADSLKQALYVGTSNGFQVTTGFASTDNIIVIDGAKSPLNHLCVTKSENWLVYLTTDGNIMGINAANVINLGRRLKDKSGTGILDSIYDTSTNVTAFGHYNENKKQVSFYFATGATYTNDTAVVIDMELGEPQQGEPAPSFESRVKCLHWKVGTATPNKSWFVSIYSKGELSYGVLSSGLAYLLESGKKDFADTAIVSYWKSPQITGGSLTRLKQWLRVNCIFALETASTALNVNAYLNRGSSSVLTSKTFDLTNGENDISYGMQRIDRRSKYLQIELGNSTINEEWTLQNMTIHYDIGAEISN